MDGVQGLGFRRSHGSMAHGARTYSNRHLRAEVRPASVRARQLRPARSVRYRRSSEPRTAALRATTIREINSIPEKPPATKAQRSHQIETMMPDEIPIGTPRVLRGHPTGKTHAPTGRIFKPLNFMTK
jgi:hypothetical protein